MKHWPFVLLVASVCSGAAQAPRFQTSTQEVLLDAVVRDKHQKMVRDLRPEEVQVFEDGVQQRISSFEFVRNKGSRLLEGSAPNRFDPLHEINLIAVVFQRMSNDGRRNASTVMHDFVSYEFRPNTLIGVFGLTNRLFMLQQFTNQPEPLRKAIDAATKANYTDFAKISAQIESSINGVRVAGTGGRPEQASVDITGWRPLRNGDASERGPESDPIVAQLKNQIQKLESTILRRVVGTYDLEALLTLVRTVAALPGRKTVVLVSEGLLVPEDSDYTLRAIISEANRANVTFYTVNATGLSPADAGDGSLHRASDDEKLLQLADDTGGFGMSNSNDLRVPLRRVMEDAASHYEITYVPSRGTFDGRFRRLELRVSRKGVKVQTRDGYFALPMLNGQMLLPFEMAGLKALDTIPLPSKFPYAVAAIRFRPAAAGVQHEVFFEIPAPQMRTALLENGKDYGVKLSVLALLKDSGGTVVDKIGRPLSVRVSADKLDAFQRGTIPLVLPLSAMPGRYTLETAVVDHNALAASAQRISLFIPVPGTPTVSDLVLVGSMQTNQGEAETPLDFSGRRATPTLTRTFERAKLTVIPVLFTVYRQDGTPSPGVNVELYHQGRQIATVTPPPADEGAGGSLPYLASIPVANLEKGQYEVVVTVRDASHAVRKMIALELN